MYTEVAALIFQYPPALPVPAALPTKISSSSSSYASSSSSSSSVILLTDDDNSTAKRIKLTSKEEKMGSECCICVQQYGDGPVHRASSLKCGHVFGFACIDRFLRRELGRVCPICQVLCSTLLVTHHNYHARTLLCTYVFGFLFF